MVDFDQSPVRRYRIIIPLLAYIVDSLFGGIFDLFHPWSFEEDFSLCFSFLMINTVIMSFGLYLIYTLCRSFQLDVFISFIVITAICSSRWSAELSGLPLVDSLYFLCLISAMYGLVTKKWAYVIASIWIGPWAKEAFIFMAPVILIFCTTQRLRLLIHFIFSGIIVFTFRYAYDVYLGHDMFHSLQEDMSSFYSIKISLARLFSFHGIYDVFSVLGFWMFIPITIALLYKSEFIQYYKDYRGLFYTYLISVVLQALLSTDISRMLYLGIPVFALWLGISLSILKSRWPINQTPDNKMQ